MTDITLLQKPFDNVRSREGAGGKHFSYVAGGDILARILEATEGMFDWEIIDLRLIEGQSKANKRTGEVYTTPPVWMVHGRLTLPGLGTRDGIGTATAETEESPKSAETDAIKRAAVKFGVALQLYITDEQAAPISGNGKHRPQASPRQPAGGAISLPPLNESGSQCPYCSAPGGARHLRSCPTLSQAAA